MVRHESGVSNCAEQDRIMLPERLKTILRYHHSVFEVVRAGVGEFRPGNGEIAYSGYGLKHLHSSVHDLWPDAISWDESDLASQSHHYNCRS